MTVNNDLCPGVPSDPNEKEIPSPNFITASYVTCRIRHHLLPFSPREGKVLHDLCARDLKGGGGYHALINICCAS